MNRPVLPWLSPAMAPNPTLARLSQRWQAAQQRRWFRWTREAVVVLLIVLVIGAWQTRGHVSGQAPDFRLRTLAGGEVSLSGLAGKPVMLVFWAPWCGVCKAQSGNVDRVLRWAGDGAHVISLAAAYGSVGEVEAAAQAEGMTYPVLLGSDRLAAEYRVEAYPTVYFLDSHGRVKHSAVGYTTTLGMLLRLWL